MLSIEDLEGACMAWVVLAAPCFLYAEMKQWYLKYWVQSKGEVVESDVDSASSGQFARIAFVEKGPAHRTERIFLFTGSCAAEEGDKVSILYNPKNPSEATTLIPDRVFHVLLPRVCGYVFTGMLVLVLGLGALERWIETRSQSHSLPTNP